MTVALYTTQGKVHWQRRTERLFYALQFSLLSHPNRQQPCEPVLAFLSPAGGLPVTGHKDAIPLPGRLPGGECQSQQARPKVRESWLSWPECRSPSLEKLLAAAQRGGDDQQRTSSRAQLSADHRSPYRSIALGGVISLKERASINLILLRKGRTHMECPTCGSQELRLSHRRNILERALSLISFRPFRCLDCNERFLKFRGRRKLFVHHQARPVEAEQD